MTTFGGDGVAKNYPRFNPACSVEKTLSVIGGKWTFLIIRDLLNGPKRFGELMRSLKTASPRTLTLRLRELEKHGIIDRHIHPQIPPRVDYDLTDKGKQLQPIFNEMKRWGERF